MMVVCDRVVTQRLSSEPYVGRACPECIPSTRGGARGIYPLDLPRLSHLSLRSLGGGTSVCYPFSLEQTEGGRK
jgi:hypothetical protein